MIKFQGLGYNSRESSKLYINMYLYIHIVMYYTSSCTPISGKKTGNRHRQAARETDRLGVREKERERERERASTGSQGITDVPLSLSLFPLTILACRSPRSIRCITKPFQSSCQQNTNLQKQKCFENLNPAT
ncbi:mCG148351 [Mus musculus]|jgi:hypothetical protein|uniref:Uncharacterized protein n=1 Tax=Mus musculus TaxID=10090 RepID=Q8CCK6_MOUSE|nr:mCG148351 [Mus musculus]BAC27945.1 unnamed protein product [Mus musculus]